MEIGRVLSVKKEGIAFRSLNENEIGAVLYGAISYNINITKMDNETILVGDLVFYKREMDETEYKTYTVNVLKSQYSDFLEITDKLTGNETLKIHIDPGSATAEKIGEYLQELSKLYQMIGGSGITFSQNNVNVLVNS